MHISNRWFASTFRGLIKNAPIDSIYLEHLYVVSPHKLGSQGSEPQVIKMFKTAFKTNIYIFNNENTQPGLLFVLEQKGLPSRLLICEPCSIPKETV